jgi:hypothetical protein
LAPAGDADINPANGACIHPVCLQVNVPWRLANPMARAKAAKPPRPRLAAIKFVGVLKTLFFVALALFDIDNKIKKLYS